MYSLDNLRDSGQPVVADIQLGHTARVIEDRSPKLSQLIALKL